MPRWCKGGLQAERDARNKKKHCNICNVDISRDHFSKHTKTLKHNNNYYAQFEQPIEDKKE